MIHLNDRIHGTGLVLPPLQTGALERRVESCTLPDSSGARVWSVCDARGAVTMSAFGTDQPMPASQRTGLAVAYGPLRWLGDSVQVHRRIHDPAHLVRECPYVGRRDPCVETDLSGTDPQLPADLLCLWRDHGYDDEAVWRQLAAIHSRHLGHGAVALPPTPPTPNSWDIERYSQ